jgi:hypothetical protein
MKKKGAVVCFLLSLMLFSVLISFFSFVSASQLRVTEEHPFFVNGEWISASDLKVGDNLTTPDGKNITIKNISDFILDENFSVYNLEANEYSNFVASSDGVGVVCIIVMF